MTTHLVIPDSHSHPSQSNNRYDWIGQLIYDIRPDVVINIGDHFDMASLSGHSSKFEMEDKRYQDDISIGIDALERLDHYVKRAKKKRPRKVFTLGNHEARIPRLVSDQPILQGKVDLSDLQLSENGWEVYPFLDPVIVDGVAYSHYFVSGVMGRPIGGDNVARSTLNKQHMSCTSGHSHLLDFATTTKADGKRIFGLVCGVYQDYHTQWNNNQSEAQWWSGVVIKRDVSHGSYDPQFVSIQALQKEYGR